MSQPQWVTPAGNLGTIAEGIFYQVPLEATADSNLVYYQLIAGRMPEGIQITSNGVVEGIPKTVEYIQGVPTEVSTDVTSTFAVRAYTRKDDGSVLRLNDRTFSLTVSGQDIPEFTTAAGSLGTFNDGTQVSIQVGLTDRDPDDTVRVSVLSGTLPPGLELSSSGLISGIITPGVTKNYAFTLIVTDGKDSNIRGYSIQVNSQEDMSADTTVFTADNGEITADASPTRTPILLTPAGDLGRVRADNYYAFQFTSIDYDGDEVEYSISTGLGVGYDEVAYDADGSGFDEGTFSLAPGLQVDPETGWLYGYIPDQGATETTYRFTMQVYKKDNPTFVSEAKFFTITIIGNIDTDITWTTPSNLGTIENGAASNLYVEAINAGGKALQYKIVQGSNSKLPQGLTLQNTGAITGRASFNTFSLDQGTTTFDVVRDTRLDIAPTTFDLTYRFTVNAFAPQTEQLGKAINFFTVTDQGSGYTSQPTITISAPPDNIETAIQATAGLATIVDGKIISIAVGNPGRGYGTAPTVTITGGGGSGAEAVAVMKDVDLVNSVSVNKEFSILVNREYNTPYNALYIRALTTQRDRNRITALLQDQSLIPYNSLYRPDDPNFGVAKNLTYVHAYGLTPTTLEKYVASLNLNHYRKSLTLGEVKTARALDSTGKTIYEVVYTEIVDDLVNNQGTSVNKSVTLPYPVTVNGTSVNTVYPNSLQNMRDQVINQVGQVSKDLPAWMTSKQSDGTVLGFKPAWVIAYVKPGLGDQIKYFLDSDTSLNLNSIDFTVDRYELDRSQSYLWNTSDQEWIPSPGSATTFDVIDRPSDLTDKGTVDYATVLPFVDVNGRTLDYIAERGGLDGAVSRSQLQGATVIFQRQEGFSDITTDDGFTKYEVLYDQVTRTTADQISAMTSFDTVGYDADGYEEPQTEVIVSGSADPLDGTAGTFDVGGFDQARILTTSERISVYTVSVNSDNIVNLTLAKTITNLDYVTVQKGIRFNNTQLYIPSVPNPGFTRIAWSLIPEEPTTATVFDGGSTVFSVPADTWTGSNIHDKYLVFPKENILY